MTRPARSIEESAAVWRQIQSTPDYKATMATDPQAADLFEEVCNDDPAPYVYREGSDRDESRLCDQVGDGHSNKIMRKFLADVERAVCIERQADYDTPPRNHARTAAIASQVLDSAITAEDVCLFNLAQKLSRCGHKLTYDTLVDFAGYAANLAAVMASRLPVNGT